ncbi:MAG TPA: hypothetical protein DCS57_05385 [Dehalococcoidia bacterium]|jgi:3-methylfumaryl-CoA hydratase|nr:hypothetical protein [Dehalococcoidia bacterium]
MNVAIGDALPEQFHTPDNVQLMFYNAALWNGHRIHFDEPYAKEVEGYPGLVIAGPLLGDWLNQVVELWLGESGRLTKIEYSNRVASYIGETLTAGGNVTAVEGNTITIEVYIKNEDGDVIAPGVATAEIIA